MTTGISSRNEMGSGNLSAKAGGAAPVIPGRKRYSGRAIKPTPSVEVNRIAWYRHERLGNVRVKVVRFGQAFILDGPEKGTNIFAADKEFTQLEEERIG